MPDPWATLDPALPDWEPANRASANGSQHVEPIITVITPTLPDRFELLHEAAMSVRAQTLAGVTHSILLDSRGDGPAAMRNAMLAMTQTPLVAFLDDDDVLDPEHLELLHATLERRPDCGIAYSYCRVTGPNRVNVPRPKNDREVWRSMRQGRNVIPVTVLARTETIRAGGGFRPEDRYEDHALWLRLHHLGHRFALCPQETWEYRMLGNNRTHNG